MSTALTLSLSAEAGLAPCFLKRCSYTGPKLKKCRKTTSSGGISKPCLLSMFSQAKFYLYSNVKVVPWGLISGRPKKMSNCRSLQACLGQHCFYRRIGVHTYIMPSSESLKSLNYQQTLRPPQDLILLTPNHIL